MEAGKSNFVFLQKRLISVVSDTDWAKWSQGRHQVIQVRHSLRILRVDVPKLFYGLEITAYFLAEKYIEYYEYLKHHP